MHLHRLSRHSMYIIMSVIVFSLQGIHGANFSRRIRGGKETTIEKFPYQVMVICDKGSAYTLCGGALLNKKTIVTAAHCVYDCDDPDLIIFTGTTERDKKHKHSVNSVTIHDGYEKGHIKNDIAIVCLKYCLRYSNRIQAISITDQLYPEGTNALVTGWGRVNNYDVSNKLRYTVVQLINNQHCMEDNPLIDNTQLCTSDDGRGPCQGDSGGPLVVHDKLIGLVAYGDVDCTAKMVRMYMNVFHYRKFIDNNLC